MKNEDAMFDIINYFNTAIKEEYFLTDRTGVKFVEKIGANIHLWPMQKTFEIGPKKTNEAYCEKELNWYDSMDLSIDMVSDVKIWRDVACKNGFINSNYGWCIYSGDNGEQYNHVLEELTNNKDSRRAIMIYTRPTMWEDYNKDGRNDFMCTNYHHFFIRENTLYSIYNIRSNDFIFGFFNDYYWGATVHQRLLKDLSLFIPNLQCGFLLWQASSLHVYERHFDLVRKMYQSYFTVDAA